MKRFAKIRIVLAMLVLGSIFNRPAFAQDPQTPISPAALPRRQANFAWDKTLLRASFSYRDALTQALIDKLSNGLPTVIAMRAAVIEEGKTTPVAAAVRSCRVVYDLWDEVYQIHITSSGERDRDRAVINVEGVMRLCAEARDMVVVDKSLLKTGTPYFLGVIVDVNPVSADMLEQMRRWVSRPTGSTGIGPSDALFGSFVGLFVRSIGSADNTVRFRTQAITP
jgi:hypothetical protein